MRHPIRLLPLLAAAVLALPAAASASVSHTVRRGETLTSIAAIDGLSVARLAAANDLSTESELVTGTQLVIPPQAGPLAPGGTVASETASSPASSETAADGSSSGGYVVRLGDTLSAIAVHFGTSTSALAAANGMSVDDLLLAGRTLTIPGGAVQTTATAPSPEDTGSGAEPVDQFVAPAEVGAIAEADGVPGALAEAIADQESGFNDDEVSATGATGVMQLEPETWNDLTRVDGLELSPDSALDNVRGGVAVLRSLLLDTGNDQDETIAAYYQGLESVRAQGIFPATRRYLRDVLALESRF
jgi:soluble lytic murein transglycosylase-like protein